MPEPLEITNGAPLPGAPAPDGKVRDNVPPTRAQRERLRAAVREYAAARRPVPPFSVDELRVHAGRILEAAGADEKYRKFAAVLLNNEAWREKVAAVPFDRRLLLLPKCLRSDTQCEGTIDEFGLLCADCGRCPISDFKTEAERLGYVVLVAEGSAVVMSLIRAGKIEAVVGVSCLAALEAVYPLMEAAAAPGVAVPLLRDGCANTAVDADWVWEAIRLNGGEASRGMDIEALRRQVESWFTPDALDAALGPPTGETERIARAWLAKSGKRWRPLLAACAYRAFRPEGDAPLPDDLRRIALAVECFHKASLVHDDIEDDDDRRYGDRTLHQQYGIPIALNVGDFLLGEGYRLLAESGLAAPRRAEMLRAAAHGHRELTIGQGSELSWARNPRPLAPAEVIDIFRRKTAPAFEVALRLGALAADATDEVGDVLARYSEALGIAYQISDDLHDGGGDGDSSDLVAMRPSILLALAYDRADGGDRPFFDALWRRASRPAASAPADAAAAADVHRRLDALRIRDEARRLMESYEDEAIRCLEPLTSADLKGLLRRVIFTIFHRTPGGPPGEPARGHAPGRRPGA